MPQSFSDFSAGNRRFGHQLRGRDRQVQFCIYRQEVFTDVRSGFDSSPVTGHVDEHGGVSISSLRHVHKCLANRRLRCSAVKQQSNILNSIRTKLLVYEYTEDILRILEN